MSTPHCFDVPSRISDDITAMINNGVKGLKKKDRFAVTMVAILNAINSSPDMPKAFKKDLINSLTKPDEAPKPFKEDWGQKLQAFNKMLQEDRYAEDDEVCKAMADFSKSLALDILWLTSCRLKQEGISYDDMPNFLGLAVTQTLCLIDDDENTFGPYAEATLKGLEFAKTMHSTATTAN